MKNIFVLLFAISSISLSQNFWEPTNGPYAVFSPSYFSHMVIDSVDNIFAVTDGGLFRSSDNGNNWSAINNGLPPTNITSIIINLRNHILLGTDDGVFRSTDNGDNWIEISSGLPEGFISSLAVNSSNHIFARVFEPDNNYGEGSIYCSKDNGEHWTKIVQNRPMYGSSIVIDSNDHIYIGGFYPTIFRSTDNGESWTYFPTNPGYIHSYVIDSNNHVFGATDAGVFKTTDSGVSWTKKNTGIANLAVWYLAINSNDDIFAENENGIFRTTNGGESWFKLKNVPGSQGVLSFGSNNNIFAGSEKGFFQSTDGGDNWVQKDFSIIIKATISNLIINKSDYIFGVYYDGLLRSTDNGDSWTKINLHDSITSISSLAINSDGYLFAGTWKGIFRSTDGGDNWTRLINSFQDALSIFINSKNDIFAVHHFGLWRIVFRSTDNGENWTTLNIYYSLLAFSSNDNIFAGDYGILRSTDNGDNWIHLDNFPNYNVNSLAIDSSTGYIFAGTYDYNTKAKSAFRSTDNGESWTEINKGLLKTTSISTFKFNSSGHVFAGTANAGVYRSTDNGDNWDDINSGLPEHSGIAALAISPRGYIFAGTSNGVFRSTNTTVSVKDGDGITPSAFALKQNYPNPFNPGTVISWQSPVGSWQTLKVYDILGNEVATLVDEYKPAGSYEMNFDASHLSSGVYFYKIEAGVFVETKKMILLH